MCRNDVGRHPFGVGLVDVQHRDLGAQAGEFACGGLAEAGAATGDEGDVVLDLHVCVSLCGAGEGW